MITHAFFRTIQIQFLDISQNVAADVKKSPKNRPPIFLQMTRRGLVDAEELGELLREILHVF